MNKSLKPKPSTLKNRQNSEQKIECSKEKTETLKTSEIKITNIQTIPKFPEIKSSLKDSTTKAIILMVKVEDTEQHR